MVRHGAQKQTLLVQVLHSLSPIDGTTSDIAFNQLCTSLVRCCILPHEKLSVAQILRRVQRITDCPLNTNDIGQPHHWLRFSFVVSDRHVICHSW